MKYLSTLHYVIHKETRRNTLDESESHFISVYADSKMIEHTIEQDLEKKFRDWGCRAIKFEIEADKDLGIVIREWAIIARQPDLIAEKVKHYFDGVEGASCTVSTDNDTLTILGQPDPKDDFKPIKDAVKILASKHIDLDLTEKEIV